MQYPELVVQARESLAASLPAEILLAHRLPHTNAQLDDVRHVAAEVLTKEQLEITSLHAYALLEAVAARKYTAVAVTSAFIARASVAQQLLSCLTDFWPDQALARARQLDEHLAKTGKIIGPLHGLPISLKDQLAIKGKKTTMSFSKHYRDLEPMTEDAHLVQILYDAGAVFYCHTNLPQTIMHLESESLFGRTLNPFNTSLTSGGSSGGESALIAFRGSLLGVGTDIGGSVRQPASAVGIYALRPTAQRVPNGGCKTYVPGRDSIIGVCGPLAHSRRDIELFMSTVCGAKASPWLQDPALQELPWREGRRGRWQDTQRRLRIGVMRHDGVVRPLPPVSRALSHVIGKLSQAQEQVELVDFPPWKSLEAWHLARRLYFVDGGQRIRDLLSATNEPMHSLTKWLLEESGPPLKPITHMHDLWELNIERDTFRAQFAGFWISQDVDVVLCPAAFGPAMPHGETKWWGYTSFWNVVDYPAVVFPVGLTVDESLDRNHDMRPWLSRPYLSEHEEALHENYDASRHKNAPLALQLVAKKNHDEEVLDALEVIERILQCAA